MKERLGSKRTVAVNGSGKRYFGGIDGQQLLEDPHMVIQGDPVLHLKFKVHC